MTHNRFIDLGEAVHGCDKIHVHAANDQDSFALIHHSILTHPLIFDALDGLR